MPKTLSRSEFLIFFYDYLFGESEQISPAYFSDQSEKTEKKLVSQPVGNLVKKIKKTTQKPNNKNLVLVAFFSCFANPVFMYTENFTLFIDKCVRVPF